MTFRFIFWKYSIYIPINQIFWNLRFQCGFQQRIFSENNAFAHCPIFFKGLGNLILKPELEFSYFFVSFLFRSKITVIAHDL